SGDGEDIRVLFADQVRRRAHAAGHDDLAVLLHRGTDCLQRLVAGGVDEAARVDHDKVGAIVLAGDLIAFGAQARDDAFGTDERLRATETDKADGWSGGGHSFCSGLSRKAAAYHTALRL